MSEKLSKLLSSVGKGITDYDQIQTIISNLIETEVSQLKYQSSKDRKPVFGIIADDCGINSEFDKMTLSEIICILFNAPLFEGLTTKNEDGSRDDYIYPRYLSYCIMYNFSQLARTNPLVAQFSNINFYSFSRYMTQKISKTDIEDMDLALNYCGRMMRALQGGNVPKETDTLLDVFNSLNKQYIRPWVPGSCKVEEYSDRILNICESAWVMMVLYPYKAFEIDQSAGINQIMSKYGIDDCDDERNPFSTECCDIYEADE